MKLSGISPPANRAESRTPDSATDNYSTAASLFWNQLHSSLQDVQRKTPTGLPGSGEEPGRARNGLEPGQKPRREYVDEAAKGSRTHEAVPLRGRRDADSKSSGRMVRSADPAETSATDGCEEKGRSTQDAGKEDGSGIASRTESEATAASSAQGSVGCASPGPAADTRVAAIEAPVAPALAESQPAKNHPVGRVPDGQLLSEMGANDSSPQSPQFALPGVQRPGPAGKSGATVETPAKDDGSAMLAADGNRPAAEGKTQRVTGRPSKIAETATETAGVPVVNNDPSNDNRLSHLGDSRGSQSAPAAPSAKAGDLSALSRPDASGLIVADQVGSTPPMAPESASAPVKPIPPFIELLTERIHLQVQSGNGEIRIQLKPEHLGSLEINAEESKNGVIAKIAAESSSVRDFLERNVGLLRQRFQEHGLNLDRIDIVVKEHIENTLTGEQNSGSAFQDSGQGRRTAGNSGSGPAPLSDAVVVDSVSLLTIGPYSTFHAVA